MDGYLDHNFDGTDHDHDDHHNHHCSTDDNNLDDDHHDNDNRSLGQRGNQLVDSQCLSESGGTRSANHPDYNNLVWSTDEHERTPVLPEHVLHGAIVTMDQWCLWWTNPLERSTYSDFQRCRYGAVAAWQLRDVCVRSRQPNRRNLYR